MMSMSKKQQNKRSRIKNRATAKEDMMIKEMLRQKLDTIDSKEQLAEEMECLWKYGKPLIDKVITLHLEAKSKEADMDILVKDAECKETYLAELSDKIFYKLSKNAEIKTLLATTRPDDMNKVGFVKKCCAANIGNELEEMLTEAALLQTEVITLHTIISKTKSDASKMEKQPAGVGWKTDKLNALLTMIEDKQIAVGTLHQEPSEKSASRALSGNLAVGLGDLFCKVTRLFGSSKTEQLFYNTKNIHV